MLAETAYAKINLALHVRGRRADGYHDIESLFAFAEEGDTLTAAVRKDGIVSLSIDGSFAKSWKPVRTIWCCARRSCSSEVMASYSALISSLTRICR